MKNEIWFLLNRLYPCDSGGVELFHYYFLRYLSQSQKICVLTNCKKFKEFESENLKVIVYPGKVFGKASFSAFVYHTYHLFLNRKRIGLVYTPYDSKSWYAPYHLILLKIIASIPYILRISGGEMFPTKPFYLHQKLFDFSDGRITVARPMKEEYEFRHKKNIKLIPSMLPFIESSRNKNHIRDELGIDHNSLVLLFVGTIKNIKGPDILLNSFMSLGLDYIKKNNLRLFFAGKGPMTDQLKKEISGTGFEGYIVFGGHIQHEKICDLYNAADIFVIPSLKEARPLSLSEALFNGMPIIGSDIKAIKNIINHKANGMLFKQGSCENLAEQIKILVENESIRIKLGQTAKANYKSQYGYDEMLKEYLKYFKTIIRK